MTYVEAPLKVDPRPSQKIDLPDQTGNPQVAFFNSMLQCRRVLLETRIENMRSHKFLRSNFLLTPNVRADQFKT